MGSTADPPSRSLPALAKATAHEADASGFLAQVGGVEVFGHLGKRLIAGRGEVCANHQSPFVVAQLLAAFGGGFLFQRPAPSAQRPR
jgi:hypothetical protein